LIIAQTPLRISLGGGSTDLPSYYEKFGGFVFGVSIQCYMHMMLKRLPMDDRIQFNYRKQELVCSVDELRHDIGREALRIAGIDRAISVTFNADSPAGTGLGSSGSCAVGLLNGLFALKGERKPPDFLAEKAFEITQRLGGDWAHDGKQDPYLAAYGGFTVLHIDRDGSVRVEKPLIKDRVRDKFLRSSLLFYTGVKRKGSSMEILREQSADRVLELKHRTKAIGIAILEAFKTGDLDAFGLLMDEHWRVKQKMSAKISNDRFDRLYEIAKENGALGGKLIGAGGGGYFLFYCSDEAIGRVERAMVSQGLRRAPLAIDYDGSRTAEPNFSNNK